MFNKAIYNNCCMDVDVILGFVFFIKTLFHYKDILKIKLVVQMVTILFLSFHLPLANSYMLNFFFPLDLYIIYHLNDQFRVVQFWHSNPLVVF